MLRNRFAIFSAASAASIVICVAPLLAAHAQSTSIAKTPEDVVKNLDAVLQARFLQTMNEFGISRITILPGHDGARMSLGRANKEEKALWDAAEAANLRFEIGFVHCAKPPATAYRSPSGSILQRYTKEQIEAMAKTPALASHRVSPILIKHNPQTPHSYSTAPEDWTSQSKSALPKLMKGQIVNIDTGDILYAIRPIKALKNECLGCHTNSKPGDTLGALLYVVAKKQAIVSTTATKL